MTASTASPTSSGRVPSVLVILAVRDAQGWLRECLQGLAAQTYPRVGVLAVDDASGDGSHDTLVGALGAERVVRLAERGGFAAAFAAGAAHPAAAAADHLLLLHDDAVLDPEAVARMVEATQIEGVDRVAIVGGKVVAHDDPRRLLDVGRSSDRFGHPYSPLQAGEIDQGQYDRVLEVLGVDSCAMLIARAAWQAVGLLDERLGDHGDLDLCWRARIAGWRVLMTPLARVRHRVVGEFDDGPDDTRSHRHGEDRAALATVAKNNSLVTLLWVLPLSVLLSLVRLLYLVISRRLDEASELLAAFGWNIVHLPGTWSRRRRVQRVRRVRDHDLRRFTESAGLRLPRWFATAEAILEEQRALDDEEEGQPAGRRLRHRTASMFSAHPVLVVSSFAVLVGGFAVRMFIGPEPLAGGALPAFPATPGGFLAELVSGYRTTGLGGVQPASPALAAAGGLSAVLFGSTALAQKALLIAGPALATILCYRACVRWFGMPGPAALAAAAYGLSSVVLWAFSDGRLATLAVLAVLPPLLERTAVVFARTDPPEGRPRVVIGLAVTLAVGVAADPGVWLAYALVVAALVAGGPRRAGGAAAAGIAAAGAAVLLFPFVPSMASGGWAALASFVGEPDPWQIARLGLGPAPGDWAPGAYLIIAALIGLGLSAPAHRRRALTVTLIVVAAPALAWAGAAGYLPGWATDPVVFVGVAAAACAVLVTAGLAAISGGVAHEAFGVRQVGAALLTVTLTVGLASQAAAAMVGGWTVGGPERVTAAWAVVDSASPGVFRVLWLSGPTGLSMPAPGGDPVGEVDAGGQVVRYQLTGRDGALAIDTGRALTGPGDDALVDSVGEIMRGGSVTGGAMLAPFAVRYVVAAPGSLPPQVSAALDRQVDLDRVPSSGLVIWRNAVVVPSAVATTPTTAQRVAIEGEGPAVTQTLTTIGGAPLAEAEGGWTGATAGGSDALISTAFDGAWAIEGSATAPERAFGWSTVLATDGAAEVRIRFGGQRAATISAWLLAAVWAVALWLTRKPVRR
jgi:GT2 family glycosyltransferase